MDRRLVQRLIRSATREERTPGKYDVFAWYAGRELQSLTVPWKSYTQRAIAVEWGSGDDGREIVTNGEPLPNGVEPHAARLIGTVRIEPPSRGT